MLGHCGAFAVLPVSL